jgi:hypothetical protein
VLVNRREIAPLAQHALEIGGHHLGAHRPLHDLADLFQNLPVVSAFLGQERRVRGYAVENPDRRELLDFLDAPGVDEQFHDELHQSLMILDS